MIPELAKFTDPRRANLASNVISILNLVPERNELFENIRYGRQYFDSIDGPLTNWKFQLVLMQLAKHSFPFSEAARRDVRELILDESYEWPKVLRVFAFDLMGLPPIPKPNKISTLGRDILIATALAILDELDFEPTASPTNDNLTGSQLVLEYLVSERGQEFADSKETIFKIWTRRHKQLNKIGLQDFNLIE